MKPHRNAAAGRQTDVLPQSLTANGLQPILTRVATVIAGDFEWDDSKAAGNLEKHGVSFEEAALALATDPNELAFEDGAHPEHVISLDVAAHAGPLRHLDRTCRSHPHHQRPKGEPP
jgi:hypothetical protein